MRISLLSCSLAAVLALANVGPAQAQRLGFGYSSSYYGGRAYSPYYGGYGYGNGYGYNYGSTAYYRGYGYTPYYGTYSYGNGPLSYYYPEPTPRQSFYNTPEAAPQYAAVTVAVPAADAQVWFGDTAMGQQGAVRLFHSPPLEAGRNFVYTIKARWLDQGKPVERERRVNVQAGQKVTVDFREAAENAPAPDAARTNPAP